MVSIIASDDEHLGSKMIYDHSLWHPSKGRQHMPTVFRPAQRSKAVIDRLGGQGFKLLLFKPSPKPWSFIMTRIR